MKKHNFKLFILSFLSFFNFACSQQKNVTSKNTSKNSSIYVSDVGEPGPNPVYQIMKFDSNGENGQVFIKDNLAWPQDIVFLENENVVLISNLSSGEINRHNTTTGAFIDHFATGIGGPTRMKIRDNLLYVLQWNNPKGDEYVLRYKLDGTPLGAFTSKGLLLSIGMDWDSDGNLYVSSYGRRAFQGSPAIPARIQKYDKSGKDLGTFINSDFLAGPTNIWFSPEGNGNLMVSDYNSGTLKKFNSKGDFINVVVSGLKFGEGVDFIVDKDGMSKYFLIGNGGTGSVKKFSLDGTFIEDLIKPGTDGLVRPNAVIIRQ